MRCRRFAGTAARTRRPNNRVRAAHARNRKPYGECAVRPAQAQPSSDTFDRKQFGQRRGCRHARALPTRTRRCGSAERPRRKHALDIEFEGRHARSYGCGIGTNQRRPAGLFSPSRQIGSESAQAHCASNAANRTPQAIQHAAAALHRRTAIEASDTAPRPTPRMQRAR